MTLSSYCLLLTACFLLLASYFLLLTSCFLLLTSYFLLLTSCLMLDRTQALEPAQNVKNYPVGSGILRAFLFFSQFAVAASGILVFFFMLFLSPFLVLDLCLISLHFYFSTLCSCSLSKFFVLVLFLSSSSLSFSSS